MSPRWRHSSLAHPQWIWQYIILTCTIFHFSTRLAPLLYEPFGYKVHAKWCTVQSRVVHKLVFQLYTPLTCTGQWLRTRMLHWMIHVNICLGSPFPSPASSHTSIRLFETFVLASLFLMEICAITGIDCIIINARYGDGFVYGRESDT